jgi:hypothetical protein
VAGWGGRAVAVSALPKLLSLGITFGKYGRFFLTTAGGITTGAAAWISLEMALAEVRRATSWSMEALAKNRVHCLTRPDDTKFPGGSGELALLFNRYVLSGQGESFDMVDESRFITLAMVRRTLERELAEATSWIQGR